MWKMKRAKDGAENTERLTARRSSGTLFFMVNSFEIKRRASFDARLNYQNMENEALWYQKL
jgi:hypothetical protein